MVGFGKHLLESRDAEWEQYYLDYEELKETIDMLKRIGHSTSGRLKDIVHMRGSITTPTREAHLARKSVREYDEYNFHQALQKEMDKVEVFVRLADQNLRESMKGLQNFLKKNGNAIQSDENLRLKGLTKAERISSELLRLEKFISLNSTAVYKILKKHDKNIPWEKCKPFYMMKLREAEWAASRYDGLVVELSMAHSMLRGKNHSLETAHTVGEFKRKTQKFWLKYEDVTRFKAFTLKHLPISQFKRSNNDFQLVNSVYFDNTSLELCHGRMERLPGAQVIRFRWYETETPEDVMYAEMKTSSTTADESGTKERFAIKPSHVNQIVSGKYNLEKYAEKKIQQGCGEEEVENYKDLAKNIMRMIQAKQLMPTCRTQCTRTAFQNTNDSSVRISLDTNLIMINERDLEDGRWYRDCSVPILDSLISEFPFAVVEIKLEDSLNVPPWITELREMGILHEVYKFSKYVHGCSVLLGDDMKALPYWLLDDLLVEKQEEIQNYLSRQRTYYQESNGPHSGAAVNSQRDPNASRRLRPYVRPYENRQTDSQGNRVVVVTPTQAAGEAISGGSLEDDKRVKTNETEVKWDADSAPGQAGGVEMNVLSNGSSDVGNGTGIGTGDYPSEPPRQTAGEGQSLQSGYEPLHEPLVSGAEQSGRSRDTVGKLRVMFNRRSKSGQGGTSPSHQTDKDARRPTAWNGCLPVLLCSGCGEEKKQKRKEYVVPMKIEPKVFFSNERTFLKWMNVVVTLTGVSVAIVSISRDMAAQLTGWVMQLVAIFFAIYACALFHVRGERLRGRRQGPYHDKFGPTVLCIGLTFCLVFTFLINVGIIPVDHSEGSRITWSHRILG